jgi:hypothetical protein
MLPWRDIEIVSPWRDIEIVSQWRDIEIVSPWHDIEIVSPWHDTEIVSTWRDTEIVSPWRDTEIVSPWRDIEIAPVTTWPRRQGIAKAVRTEINWIDGLTPRATKEQKWEKSFGKKRNIFTKFHDFQEADYIHIL